MYVIAMDTMATTITIGISTIAITNVSSRRGRAPPRRPRIHRLRTRIHDNIRIPACIIALIVVAILSLSLFLSLSLSLSVSPSLALYI